MAKRLSPAVWPASAVLLAAIAIILVSALQARLWPNWALLLYAIWTLLESVVAFVLFAVDKKAAQSTVVPQPRRVSEATLYTVAFLGGWPGAVWGQQYFRHKSSKVSFRAVLWLIVTLHVAAWIGVWYLHNHAAQN